MTCNDCIHGELCMSRTDTTPFTKTEYRDLDNVEEFCEDFKNKADFVEVPCRCKDCRYSEVTDNGRFHNKIYCFQPAPIKQIVETEEERFCSYGKRKE